MYSDINNFFSEDSIFMTRYNLTDELFHKIQFFYECSRNYKKTNEDLEDIILCVLLVVNDNCKINVVDEIRYLASVLFDESEMNRRQMNIYGNFDTFIDNYVKCEWYWNWKVTNNDTGLKS